MSVRGEGTQVGADVRPEVVEAASEEQGWSVCEWLR